MAARDGDLVGPGVTALVFLGAWLWLLDGYLFTRVELDARGLTLRRRGGARALAWAELAAWRVVKAEALTHLVIEGRGERWRVWATVLDFEGLCAALSDRRPPRCAEPVAPSSRYVAASTHVDARRAPARLRSRC